MKHKSNTHLSTGSLSLRKTRAKAKSAIGAVYQLSYPTAVDTNAPLTKTSSQLPKKYHETI